ncbi:MAG: hypothetical protein IJ756_05305 [Paludibacteraceae bacterium]|nr:hypothetical protein [Paludibacteraceae bacterium]
MKKVFSIFAISIVAGMAMTGCQKNKTNTTFTFKFVAGEHLIDYVVPTAEYIDAQGEKRSVEITKTMLKEDSEGLVGNPNGKKYLVWQCDITLEGKGHQRDMKISYQKRNDHPDIDAERQYNMVHSISSYKTYSNTNYFPGEKTDLYITIGGDYSNIDPTSVSGKDMETYIEYLMQHTDYKLETE